MKHEHEFRDPIYAFITLRAPERKIIDSRPFQRLRHIHQLALTYLVYPGTTHRRFEHSIGVMESATKIFDVVTKEENIRQESVRNIIPDEDGKRYWRSVLRAASLCHDIGHLPFSHAAEDELLPNGYDHEKLTVKIIESDEMKDLWGNLIPPLIPEHVAKVAVGPQKYKGDFSNWEILLSEIITGDSFGADRMDYLLRDSYHAGVAYGRFDYHRLIQSLRILPREDQDSGEPALGLVLGGLESSEALMLARHFMFRQVYFHPVRRAYDIHLKEFMREWLPNGTLPIDVEGHLKITDSEVNAAIRSAARDKKAKGHDPAHRIENRDHFRLLYTASSPDKMGGVLKPGQRIAEAAIEKFGASNIRHDFVPPKNTTPDFPILTHEGTIESSLRLSSILEKLPVLEVDYVYCDQSVRKDAELWRSANKNQILKLS